MGRRDERDLARVLYRRARGDALVVERLSADPEIPDHVIGFHAQQAVEKLLKAVLAVHGVSYGRTHDLGRLIELIAEHDLPSPPTIDRLVTLTPWAAALRYGEDPVEPEPFDRREAGQLISAVREWTESLLGLG